MNASKARLQNVSNALRVLERPLPLRYCLRSGNCTIAKLRHAPRPLPPQQRPLLAPSSAVVQTGFHRFNTTSATPPSDAAKDKRRTIPYKPAPHRNPDEPVYQLVFTCKACSHRSAHTVSKQGYHKGTVLISCPGCKNRHLISDHLHIFSDQATTIEDIMKSKGEDVQKGSVDRQGDVEFWAQGTVDAKQDEASSQPIGDDSKQLPD